MTDVAFLDNDWYVTDHDAFETALVETAREVRDELIASDDNDISTASEINQGYCLRFAEEIITRLGFPRSLELVETGGMNWLHVWVRYSSPDGFKHVDAEVPVGVTDFTEVPMVTRNNIHPEESPYVHDLDETLKPYSP
jgi:hypothetical protein